MTIVVKRLKALDGTGKIKAFLDVEISHAVTINGCKVVQGSDGLFVGLPSTQGKDGRWRPVVEITNEELMASLRAACLAAYERGSAEGAGVESPF